MRPATRDATCGCHNGTHCGTLALCSRVVSASAPAILPPRARLDSLVGKPAFARCGAPCGLTRRVREMATDFSTASELDIAIEHPQTRQERRDVLARKLWYIHSLLLAAADAQKGNRKRAFNLRTNRALFAAHAACLTAVVGSRSFARRPLCDGLSESAERKARQTLKEYLDLGEAEPTRRGIGRHHTRRADARIARFCGNPRSLRHCGVTHLANPKAARGKLRAASFCTSTTVRESARALCQHNGSVNVRDGEHYA